MDARGRRELLIRVLSDLWKRVSLGIINCEPDHRTQRRVWLQQQSDASRFRRPTTCPPWRVAQFEFRHGEYPVQLPRPVGSQIGDTIDAGIILIQISSNTSRNSVNSVNWLSQLYAFITSSTDNMHCELNCSTNNSIMPPLNL